MECFPTDECKQSNKYHPTINLCVVVYFKDTMVDEPDQIQEPYPKFVYFSLYEGKKTEKAHFLGSWEEEQGIGKEVIRIGPQARMMLYDATFPCLPRI